MLMINEHISLNLEKTSPFTDTFALAYEKDGTEYVEQRDASSLSGELYKDSQNKAVLLISRLDKLRLRGIVNEEMIIDPDEDGVVNNGAVRHRLSIRKRPGARQYHGDDMEYALRRNERFQGRSEQRKDNAISERSDQNPRIWNVTVRTSVVVSAAYIAGFDRSHYSAVTDLIDYLAVFFASVNAFFEKLKTNLELQLAVTSVVLLKESSENFVQVVQGAKNVIYGSTLVTLNQFADMHKNVISKDDIVLYLSNSSISTNDASGPKTTYAAGEPSSTYILINLLGKV
ncbi:hypothetical protein V5799_012231 [Amblyomma americanum]|uniref:Uncharacterized protein n=1 Tax=Amblyomma americanum TaxID=6943 RepID=A0AAQ4EES8_AMBAM